MITALYLRAVSTAKQSAKQRVCSALILAALITSSKPFETVRIGSDASIVSMK